MQNTIDTNTATDTPYAKYRETVTNAGYAPDNRDLILWLLGHAEEHGWSVKVLASKVGCSAKPLLGVLNANYGYNPANIIRLVSLYRERFEARKMVVDIPFVDTSISQRIHKAIEYGRTYGEIVSIIGHSQWGKTTAITEYQRRKQAQGDDTVIILRMPVDPSPHRVSLDLCEALGISRRLSYARAMRHILQTVTSRHTLIIDECHQATMAHARGKKTIEMLREIYDMTGCALVLVGTNVWGAALNGQIVQEWAGVLDQTVLRGTNIQLPPHLSYDDMQAIWQAYGLPDPDTGTAAGKAVMAVVEDIVTTRGLGRYTKRLRGAATAANLAGKPLTWETVMSVHRQLEELAGNK